MSKTFLCCVGLIAPFTLPARPRQNGEGTLLNPDVDTGYEATEHQEFSRSFSSPDPDRTSQSDGTGRCLSDSQTLM